MKISILEQKENILKMILEGITPALANSLRRIMIAEVPSLAIEDVWIVENNSPLYDEIIAHRLGLIPLKTDLETYVLPSQCGCEGEGCPQCQVAFTLTKEALESEAVTVYSGDLQSEDPQAGPYSQTIPIVELTKGQKIVLEAYAKLGTGEEHAKWQPATCSYKYLPLLKIDYERCEKCEKCVDACPRHILSFKNDQIQIQNAMTCNFCMSCEEACEVEPEKAIQVGWHETKFIFTVESSGAIPPDKIVIKAIEVLKEKIKEFLNQLKSL